MLPQSETAVQWSFFGSKGSGLRAKFSQQATR